MKENIFLIGMPGCGKSAVGRHLAFLRQGNFVDLDEEIMRRTGVDIPTLFATEGEDGFRDRESALIDEITQQSNLVLCTGGGAVLRPQNRHWLHERGTVVYMQATLEILWERLRRNLRKRPLFATGDPQETLNSLYEKRASLYETTAHFIFPVTSYPIPESAKRLQELLQQRHDDPPPSP